MPLTDPPLALLTDVFGTVVDWRSSVTNHLSNKAAATVDARSMQLPEALRDSLASVSWPAFAQAWRDSYHAFTRSYDPAAVAAHEQFTFTLIDTHFRNSLVALLQAHGLADLWTTDEITQIAKIWHALDPWPDSARGLAALGHKFTTSTLSNGNTALLRDLAAHGHLPYHRFLGAQDFAAYKPHPAVYRGAAAALGLQPSQCALVAAHLGDLSAARDCGFRCIYIERDREEEWDSARITQARQDGWVDIWIDGDQGGFLELARRLGCALDSGGNGKDKD